MHYQGILERESGSDQEIRDVRDDQRRVINQLITEWDTQDEIPGNNGQETPGTSQMNENNPPNIQQQPTHEFPIQETIENDPLPASVHVETSSQGSSPEIIQITTNTTTSGQSIDRPSYFNISFIPSSLLSSGSATSPTQSIPRPIVSATSSQNVQFSSFDSSQPSLQSNHSSVNQFNIDNIQMPRLNTVRSVNLNSPHVGHIDHAIQSQKTVYRDSPTQNDNPRTNRFVRNSNVTNSNERQFY
jgi:hypothetical protein